MTEDRLTEVLSPRESPAEAYSMFPVSCLYWSDNMSQLRNKWCSTSSSSHGSVCLVWEHLENVWCHHQTLSSSWETIRSSTCREFKTPPRVFLLVLMCFVASPPRTELFWLVKWIHRWLVVNLLCNRLSYLLRFGAAMEADVIEGGVIEAGLVFLHLGLNAADSSFGTTLAPTSIFSPLCAGPLQCWVAAAAELDVVHGCVIPKETLVGLHTNLERGEHACGAVYGVGPLPEAGQEEIWERGKSLEKMLAQINGRTSRYVNIWTPNLQSWQERCFQIPSEHDGKLPVCSFLLLTVLLWFCFSLLSTVRLVPVRSSISFTR